MHNIIIKQPPTSQIAPLKDLNVSSLSETLRAVRRNMPYSFVDSGEYCILNLTPRSAEHLGLETRAFYHDTKGHIVAYTKEQILNATLGGKIDEHSEPNPKIKMVMDRMAKIQDSKDKYKDDPDYAFLFIPGDEADYYKTQVAQYQSERKHTKYYQPTHYTQPEIQEESSNQHGFEIMSEPDRVAFSQMLRELCNQKLVIGKAMVFCLDHANSSAEIVHMLVDSLCQQQSWSMKLCRLYLISDILYNATWSYKIYLQHFLPKIFENLEELLQFKEKVMKVLSVWRESSVYDAKYIKGLEVSFSCGELSIDCSAKEQYQVTRIIIQRINQREPHQPRCAVIVKPKDQSKELPKSASHD